MNSIYNYKNNEDALLRCNKSIYGPTTFVLPNMQLQAVNQPISSVTIDTALMKKPTILIDFAGILTQQPNSVEDTVFNFTLYRTCASSSVPQPLVSYVFIQQTNIPPFPRSSTLKFEYSTCDDSCEECCTYMLELTSIRSGFAPPTTTTVTINGTLSALAVDSSN